MAHYRPDNSLSAYWPAGMIAAATFATTGETDLSATTLIEMVGKVNRARFCGRPAGTVLFTGIHIAPCPSKPPLRGDFLFSYRMVPWTHYEEVDFSPLPETELNPHDN